MKNTWVSFLIVLSIALQSLVAVADSDENHQVDLQHLQTEHSHTLDNVALSDDSSENHNITDCHHCGHCQGSHTQWLTSEKMTDTTSKLLTLNQYFYRVLLDNGFTEELIRPPIA